MRYCSQAAAVQPARIRARAARARASATWARKRGVRHPRPSSGRSKGKIERRREVDRDKREKEHELRGLPRSPRNSLARSLNPLEKLFDGAADTNPQTKYTVNPDPDRNPHPSLTPARPQASPPRTPPRPASAFGNLPTTAGAGTNAFPYGFTPLRTLAGPLTDTRWTQLLRLNQHIQRLPQDPACPLPLLLMLDPLFFHARLWSPGLRISAKASCAAEHARRAVWTG